MCHLHVTTYHSFVTGKVLTYDSFICHKCATSIWLHVTHSWQVRCLPMIHLFVTNAARTYDYMSLIRDRWGGYTWLHIAHSWQVRLTYESFVTQTTTRLHLTRNLSRMSNSYVISHEWVESNLSRIAAEIIGRSSFGDAGLLWDNQGSFADIQGSFADIQGSFKSLEYFVDT